MKAIANIFLIILLINSEVYSKTHFLAKKRLKVSPSKHSKSNLRLSKKGKLNARMEPVLMMKLTCLALQIATSLINLLAGLFDHLISKQGSKLIYDLQVFFLYNKSTKQETCNKFQEYNFYLFQFLDTIRISNFMSRIFVYNTLKSKRECQGFLTSRDAKKLTPDCESLFRTVVSYDSREKNLVNTKVHLLLAQDHVCMGSEDTINEIEYFKGRTKGALELVNRANSMWGTPMDAYLGKLDLAFEVAGVVEESAWNYQNFVDPEGLNALGTGSPWADFNNNMEVEDKGLLFATINPRSVNNQAFGDSMFKGKNGYVSGLFIRNDPKSVVNFNTEQGLKDFRHIFIALPFQSFQDLISFFLKMKDSVRAYRKSTNRVDKLVATLEILMNSWPLIFWMANMIYVYHKMDDPSNLGSDIVAGSKFMNEFYSVFAINQLLQKGLEIAIILLKIVSSETKLEDLNKETKTAEIDIEIRLEEKKLKSLKDSRSSTFKKLIFFLILCLLPPLIFIGFRYLVKMLLERGLMVDAIMKVFDYIIDVIVFLKLVKNILKFIAAIVNLIKVIYKYYQVKKELGIERVLIDNYKNMIQNSNRYLLFTMYLTGLKTVNYHLGLIVKDIETRQSYAQIYGLTPIESYDKIEYQNSGLKPNEITFPFDREFFGASPKLDKTKLLTDTFTETKSVQWENKTITFLKMKSYDPSLETNFKSVNPYSDLSDTTLISLEKSESQKNGPQYKVYPYIPLKVDRILNTEIPEITILQLFNEICAENGYLCHFYQQSFGELFISHGLEERELNIIASKAFNRFQGGPIVNPFILPISDDNKIPQYKSYENIDYRFSNLVSSDGVNIPIVYRRNFYSNYFLSKVTKISGSNCQLQTQNLDQNAFQISENLSLKDGKPFYTVDFYIIPTAEQKKDDLIKGDCVFFIYSSMKSIRNMEDISILHPLENISKENTAQNVEAMISFSEEMMSQKLTFNEYTLEWNASFNVPGKGKRIPFPLQTYHNYGAYVEKNGEKKFEETPDLFPIDIYSCKCGKDSVKLKLYIQNVNVSTGNDFKKTSAIYKLNLEINEKEICNNLENLLPVENDKKKIFARLLGTRPKYVPSFLPKGEYKHEPFEGAYMLDKSFSFDELEEKKVFILNEINKNKIESCKTLEDIKAFENDDGYKKCSPKVKLFQDPILIDKSFSFSSIKFEDYFPNYLFKPVLFTTNIGYFTNEEQVKYKLKTLDDFRKLFFDKVSENCKKENEAFQKVGKPIIQNELGIGYAHSEKPQNLKDILKDKSQSNEIWKGSVKGKVLFNLGSNDPCFKSLYLKKKWRALIPLQKINRFSTFMFKLYRASIANNKKAFVFKIEDIDEDQDEPYLNDFGSNETTEISTDLSIEEPEETEEEKFRFKEIKNESTHLQNKESNHKIFLSNKSQTKDENELTQSFLKEIDSRNYKITFPRIYIFYFIEVWFQPPAEEDTLHLNNKVMEEFVTDNCIVPFWPKTKIDYSKLNDVEESLLKKSSLPIFMPTGDLIARFYYNSNRRIGIRIWVQTDINLVYEKHYVNKIGGCTAKKGQGNQKIFRKRHIKK